MPPEGNGTASAPPQPGFRPYARRPSPGGWRIPTPRRSEHPAPAAPRDPAPRTGLSTRDRVLLEHLARGDSTRQIALALSVSRNTARTRIRRVAAKLGMPDRGRLTRAAHDLVLI